MRGLERLFSTDLSDFAHDVRFAPGGAELVAATLSGDVVLLDAQTGEPRWARAGVHAGGALSASFSPDGTVVASGGQDGRVCFFDARSGEELRRVIAGAEDAWVSRVEWREGSVLAAAAGRGVRFFSKEGEARGEVAGLPSTVAALAWHAPSSTWLAAHYGGVALLDEGAPKPKRRLAYRGAIVTLGASPNGRFVATGNQDSTVRFWDLEAGEDASLTGYPAKVRVLAWSPDSSVLATGGGAAVVAWVCAGGRRSPEGTQPVTLEHHARRVSGLAFSADGRSLFSSGEDGKVCRWALGEGAARVGDEADCGVPLHALARHEGRGLLACSGAGGRLAVFHAYA